MAEPAKIQQIVSAALTNGCEVTLLVLIDALGATGMALDQLEAVRNFMSEWSLEITPPLSTGDFGTHRALRLLQGRLITAESLTAEIRQGEAAEREYKSSLLYSHKKAKEHPNTPIMNLRSDEVLFATMKTIAAFLNTRGGTLIVGVSDDGDLIGLAQDCELLGYNTFSSDKWELELRNQVTGKFIDGNLVNDYLNVAFVEIGSMVIARIQVLARTRLSFIRLNGPKLYRRQGNRTMEVMFEDVQDYLDQRGDYRG